VAAVLILAACEEPVSVAVAMKQDALAYEDPYLYDYYYVGDLAYAGMAWADEWEEGSVPHSPGDEAPAGAWGFGGLIRALARGETVCPEHVTVTPLMAPGGCAGGATGDVRSGVTVVFSGCPLADGSSVSGRFAVEVRRSAAETACSATTSITVVATGTATDLSLTGPTGVRVVVPEQVDTATATYGYGRAPGPLSIESRGRLEIHDRAGSLIADHGHLGVRRVVASPADGSYALSGNVNVEDNHSSATASLLGTDLTRTGGCCRPTSGTLAVRRTGGSRPGQHGWSFGPVCGQASYDGTPLTLPACR
jgi:hypothetical protein